jgi:uncharacterized protein (UPF0332 family)
MNPRDFLDVAGELAAESTEAHWRSAISRAYYAAFHIARGLLRRCGFAVPFAGPAHEYLPRRLMNGGHPDVSRAGDLLTDLRQRRNRADYDLGRPVDEQAAVDAVLDADDVIRTLEAVPTVRVVQAAITQAMRDYERNVLGEVTWQP